MPVGRSQHWRFCSMGLWSALSGDVCCCKKSLHVAVGTALFAGRLTACCHAQDIKPSNFLLKEPAGTRPQLEIRVVDFGCSQRIQAVRNFFEFCLARVTLLCTINALVSVTFMGLGCMLDCGIWGGWHLGRG